MAATRKLQGEIYYTTTDASVSVAENIFFAPCTLCALKSRQFFFYGLVLVQIQSAFFVRLVRAKKPVCKKKHQHFQKKIKNYGRCLCVCVNKCGWLAAAAVLFKELLNIFISFY